MISDALKQLLGRREVHIVAIALLYKLDEENYRMRRKHQQEERELDEALGELILKEAGLQVNQVVLMNDGTEFIVLYAKVDNGIPKLRISNTRRSIWLNRKESEEVESPSALFVDIDFFMKNSSATGGPISPGAIFDMFDIIPANVDLKALADEGEEDGRND